MGSGDLVMRSVLELRIILRMPRRRLNVLVTSLHQASMRTGFILSTFTR